MPTYDFVCGSCQVAFEVFRPMTEAGFPATCNRCGGEATRCYGVAEMYVRDRAPVTRAQVRKGGYWDQPGSIVDHIVVGDGQARQRHTERELLQAAKENGIPATQDTIVLKGPPARPRARGLISYPGRPARRQTRDEARH